MTAVQSPEATADQVRSDDLRMVAAAARSTSSARSQTACFSSRWLLLTRSLTRSASGAFFEAVALFLILSNTAEPWG